MLGSLVPGEVAGFPSFVAFGDVAAGAAVLIGFGFGSGGGGGGSGSDGGIFGGFGGG